MWLRFAQLGVLMLGLTASAAAWAQSTPTTIPDAIKLPPQSTVALKAYATGTQIYTCAPRASDPSTFDWAFKAPDAELRNEAGERIGRHYAGPTWEANDGSRVTGEAVARADAPLPDAVPWLLLQAKTTEGTGLLSTVTYVQRLETVGGAAPAEGCDPSTAGAERAVPYQATYAFAFSAAP